jgi:hypothetical protein
MKHSSQLTCNSVLLLDGPKLLVVNREINGKHFEFHSKPITTLCGKLQNLNVAADGTYNYR